MASNNTARIQGEEIFHDVVLEPSDEDDNIPDAEQGFSAISCRPYVSMSPQYIPRRGLVKYSAALKHLLPYRKRSKEKNVIQVDNAGFFSFITFSWLSKYVYLAYRKGLTIEDIPLCSPSDSCDLNAQRLELLWQNELGKKGPNDASFGRAVWQFIRTRILLAACIFLISCMLGFLIPAIFMRKLLEFTEDPGADFLQGLIWAIAFTSCELLRTMTFALYNSISYRTAIRLRAACLLLVYRKIIRANPLEPKAIGQIINIFGSDEARLCNMVIFGPMIIGGPIVVICCALYIYFILGPWALLGMSAFLLFYPLQYLLSRITGSFRERTIRKTDERLKLITEILTRIKLIKMYAWESCFVKRVKDVRDEELSLLLRGAYCESIGISMAPTVPVISGILTFIIHVLTGGNLTASQDLLVVEEMGQHMSRPADDTVSLSINEGNFTWRYYSEQNVCKKNLKKNNKENIEKEKLSNEGNEVSFTLQSINLCVTKGSLIGICGAVGSGKSSLLQACLGQMKLISGQICKSGRSAYVSQEAWIENTTLKENILFREPFDTKRYINALYCCALNEDVNFLPAGDETEIGERGVNLSGGQKQRVSLARALYANRDIYFLDDPLSAVDYQVASHIFENCILNALNKKTVFLVTHHMRFLQKCDEILVMKDGKIVERGTHHELLSKEREYCLMVESNTLISAQPPTDEVEDKNKSEDILMETAKKESTFLNPKSSFIKKFVTSEEQIKGGVRAFTYHAYVKAAGGFFICFVVFMSIFINVGSTTLSSWWLAVWIRAGSGNTSIVDPTTNETVISTYINHNPDLGFYLQVYGCIIGVICVTSLLRGVTFTKVTIRASRILHKNILEKLIKSRLRYFENTPIGRIQNIFSKDLDEVDCRLPGALETLLQNMWMMMFAFLFIIMVFPWFIVALFILVIFYYIIGKIFRVAIRDLKRIEAISLAPIFSNISATMNGLPIIHAFGKESDFLIQFCKKFDENSVCAYMTRCAMRWMAIRLDCISVVIALITSMLAVFLKGEVAPALIGLALTYSAHISGVFQYTLRLMTETEGRFIAVERMLLSVKRMESEANVNGTVEVPSNWPPQGCLKFQNVKLNYSKDLPAVLNGVTFTIKPGEKIGIVGRTGAGKSSLVAALFRLTEISQGTIHIDGVDISYVSLPILRSRISVIPQDPVVFSGTLRYNLDPFKKHNDNDIWDALRQTKLLSKVQLMSNGLSTPVGEGGDNLSLGECQLLCLARALLRSSKILILDEATASVDPDTESAIQSAIDENFHHCTILTIAHRLTTVRNSDRVLVMDQGMVQEFDCPDKLLENSNSLFSKMISGLK